MSSASRRSKSPRRILVLRFRQMGDAVIATALCSTLKKSFPHAEVHMVLNSGLAPLFEGHPDIDKVIPFKPSDNKPLPAYLSKIRQTMREGHYDMIVDMRSTLRTLLFSAFAPFTPWRLGRVKSYTHLLLNGRTENADPALGLSRIDRDIMLLNPLKPYFDIKPVRDMTLAVSAEEKQAFRDKMQQGGIDLSRPVMLVGVTTKIVDKCWPKDRMIEVMRMIIDEFPDWQFIFNYAPGRERDDAYEIYESLGHPEAVKIDIEARSLRELAAMTACCQFYFGNEGGSRHIAQALGVPSFALFSPAADMTVWMPKTSTPAQGMEWSPTSCPSAQEVLAHAAEMIHAISTIDSAS